MATKTKKQPKYKGKPAKPRVYLSDEDKLKVLRDLDELKLNGQKVAEKWGISYRTVYQIKQQLWGIYLSTKDTVTAKDKIATINTVKIDSSRKLALLEKKSFTVLEKLLNIIEHKLDIEEMRLKGEYETDEKVNLGDLTRFFQAAAPYFFKPVTPDDQNVKTITKTHSYITNILNQQFHGSTKNTNQGDSQE